MAKRTRQPGLSDGTEGQEGKADLNFKALMTTANGKSDKDKTPQTPQSTSKKQPAGKAAALSGSAAKKPVGKGRESNLEKSAMTDH